MFTNSPYEAVGKVKEAEPNPAIGLNIGMKQAEEFLRLFPSPRPSTVVLPAIASVIGGRQGFTSYIEQVKQHRLKLYVLSLKQE